MPDTILSNGVRLIAGGDTAWKPSTDSNLTLFNTLLGRVTTLESLHGGGISNYWPIPAGSATPWADAMAIIDDAGAAASPSSHQWVVLPNEPMVRSSHKQLPDDITFCGSGPLSELVTVANTVDAFGGSVGLRAGNRNVISNFIMRDDRVTMGSSGRLLSIVVNANDVEIAGMTFTDSSATCCYVGGPANNRISFHHNTSNDAWEQFLELAGEIDGLQASYNTALAVTSNPVIAGTEPCGFFIGNEQGPAGDIKNVQIGPYNTIDFRGGPGDFINSFPMTFSDGAALPIEWRYDRIIIGPNNTFRGGACGVRIQNLRNAGAACTVHVIENFIDGQYLEGIQIGDESADFAYVIHNEIHRPAGSAHPFVDAAPGAFVLYTDRNTEIQD